MVLSCEKCKTVLADRVCDQCEASYCAECFDKRHRKGAFRRHTYTPASADLSSSPPLPPRHLTTPPPLNNTSSSAFGVSAVVARPFAGRGGGGGGGGGGDVWASAGQLQRPVPQMQITASSTLLSPASSLVLPPPPPGLHVPPCPSPSPPPPAFDFLVGGGEGGGAAAAAEQAESTTNAAKFCSSCGAKSDGGTFCSQCGNRLTLSAASSNFVTGVNSSPQQSPPLEPFTSDSYQQQAKERLLSPSRVVTVVELEQMATVSQNGDEVGASMMGDGTEKFSDVTTSSCDLCGGSDHTAATCILGLELPPPPPPQQESAPAAKKKTDAKAGGAPVDSKTLAERLRGIQCFHPNPDNGDDADGGAVSWTPNALHQVQELMEATPSGWIIELYTDTTTSGYVVAGPASRREAALSKLRAVWTNALSATRDIVQTRQAKRWQMKAQMESKGFNASAILRAYDAKYKEEAETFRKTVAEARSRAFAAAFCNSEWYGEATWYELLLLLDPEDQEMPSLDAWLYEFLQWRQESGNQPSPSDDERLLRRRTRLKEARAEKKAERQRELKWKTKICPYMDNKAGTPCSFFFSSVVLPTNSVLKGSIKSIHDWRSGRCEKGDKCKFSHDTTSMMKGWDRFRREGWMVPEGPVVWAAFKHFRHAIRALNMCEDQPAASTVPTEHSRLAESRPYKYLERLWRETLDHDFVDSPLLPVNTTSEELNTAASDVATMRQLLVLLGVRLKSQFSLSSEETAEDHELVPAVRPRSGHAGHSLSLSTADSLATATSIAAATAVSTTTTAAVDRGGPKKELTTAEKMASVPCAFFFGSNGGKDMHWSRICSAGERCPFSHDPSDFEKLKAARGEAMPGPAARNENFATMVNKREEKRLLERETAFERRRSGLSADECVNAADDFFLKKDNAGCPTPCFYFFGLGGSSDCDKGDRCEYSHQTRHYQTWKQRQDSVEPSQRHDNKHGVPCVYFQRDGVCKFGDECHNAHESTPKSEATAEIQQQQRHRGTVALRPSEEEDDNPAAGVVSADAGVSDEKDARIAELERKLAELQGEGGGLSGAATADSADDGDGNDVVAEAQRLLARRPSPSSRSKVECQYHSCAICSCIFPNWDKCEDHLIKDHITESWDITTVESTCRIAFREHWSFLHTRFGLPLSAAPLGAVSYRCPICDDEDTRSRAIRNLRGRPRPLSTTASALAFASWDSCLRHLTTTGHYERSCQGQQVSLEVAKQACFMAWFKSLPEFAAQLMCPQCGDGPFNNWPACFAHLNGYSHLPSPSDGGMKFQCVRAWLANTPVGEHDAIKDAWVHEWLSLVRDKEDDVVSHNTAVALQRALYSRPSSPPVSLAVSATAWSPPRNAAATACEDGSSVDGGGGGVQPQQELTDGACCKMPRRSPPTTVSEDADTSKAVATVDDTNTRGATDAAFISWASDETISLKVACPKALIPDLMVRGRECLPCGTIMTADAPTSPGEATWNVRITGMRSVVDEAVAIVRAYIAGRDGNARSMAEETDSGRLEQDMEQRERGAVLRDDEDRPPARDMNDEVELLRRGNAALKALQESNQGATAESRAALMDPSGEQGEADDGSHFVDPLCFSFYRYGRCDRADCPFPHDWQWTPADGPQICENYYVNRECEFGDACACLHKRPRPASHTGDLCASLVLKQEGGPSNVTEQQLAGECEREPADGAIASNATAATVDSDTAVQEREKRREGSGDAPDSTVPKNEDVLALLEKLRQDNEALRALAERKEARKALRRKSKRAKKKTVAAAEADERPAQLAPLAATGAADSGVADPPGSEAEADA